MKRSIAICIAILTCFIYSPSLVFAELDVDPFYAQGVSKDIPPLNNVSESIDPFSGIMTLTHTDLHLPGNGGLDLNLVRTYNSMIWGKRPTGGLIALNRDTLLGIGWFMHMGKVWHPNGSGSPNRFAPDNPIFEMPDGSRHEFYTDINDSSRKISKEFWVYKIRTTGAIWDLTLTDGTVYTFEKISNLDDAAHVTKITNAAGTASIIITYVFYGGHPYLKTITDSANRIVTFVYDETNFRLNAINVGNMLLDYTYPMTIKYTYTKNGTYNFLASYIPPVGNPWTYEYEPGTTYELSAINYPTGGRIAYTYGDIPFATGGTNVAFRVVTGRNTSGTGIPAGAWKYTYESSNTGGLPNKTTITAPGVTEIHTFYGWGNTGNGNVWKVGLPISKQYSGAFSLSETYTWPQSSSQISKISNDGIACGNWTGTVNPPSDTAIYVPFLSSKTITRDGKTYTTTNTNYNYYGNPGTISETGDLNRSKTITYWTNPAKNIVADKPATETVSGGFSGTSSTTWTYDTNSGNVKTINKNGVITTYGYGGDGNVSSITDANNHQKTYVWKNGRISSVTIPGYYSESRVVNYTGTIASETNGRNYTTGYTYDKNQRLTSITPPATTPAGNVTTISYALNNSYKTESRGGYTLTSTYDGFGRPSGSSDSKGITTSITYNAYGLKSTSDTNVGDLTNYDYFGRPTKATHKDTNAVNYAYSGSNVTITDENSASSVYTYNAFGNPDEKYLMSVRDQGANVTTYSRNILGLLTGITQSGATRSFTYNTNKGYFLTSETNPETGTITYGRDNVGNMSSKTDSSGTKTFTYDNINRNTGITASGSTIGYVYDNADNRTSMTSPSASIGYVYDAANRLTTKNETIAGRAYPTAYVYDGNDNVTRITYPSGRVVNQVVNGNSQVTSITGFVTSVAYNTSGVKAGLLSSYTLATTPALTTTLSYNNRPLVTAIANSAMTVGYGYDSRGNTTSFTNNLASNQSFSYDALSRLTVFNGAWGTGSFVYNALGNRTTKTVAGSASTYTYTSNRLTSTTGGEAATYSYIGNGLLSGGSWGGGSYTLTYDPFDNLASYKLGSTSLADFTYDADGMRVTKASGGKTVVYHYDQGGRTLSENYSNGTSIADYIYLNGKMIAKVSYVAPSISVAPPAESFGNVLVNATSAAQTVTVRNDGTANLIIGTIAFTGVNPTEFIKTADTCSGKTIAPTSSCAVQVAFKPASTGAKTAYLSIPSNDPVTATYNASLNGIGILPTLSVTKSGTGTGTVTSPPAGISCGSTCSSPSTTGTQITLTAAPAAGSEFIGWSNACSGTTSTCTLTLSADKTATATFNTINMARILESLTLFSTLQAAFDTGQTGNTLQGRNLSTTQTLIHDNGTQLIFKGGYDNTFTNITGTTTLRGPITISNGSKLTVDKLTIQLP